MLKSDIEIGNLKSVVLISVGVTVVCGFAEWLVFGELGYGLRQDEACRTILAITILYGLLGLVLGVISTVFFLAKKSLVMAVSLPLAVLIALAVFREKQSFLFLAAAFALGWLCHLAFRRIYLKCHKLWQPRLWWLSQGFILAGALALTTFKAPNTQNLLLAIGIAGITTFILIWDLIRGCVNLWRCVLATVMVVIACWFLGFRVPVIAPKVEANTDLPSVLLITIDTLRADHVGAYGYVNARTPYLDSLAKRGVLFREVVAPDRLTGPSHASILTGLLPEKHGVLNNMVPMAQSIATLADILSTNGYVTASFVSSLTTVDSSCGLPSHFQVYYDNIDNIPWFPKKAYNVLLFGYSRKILEVFLRFDFEPVYRTGAKTTNLAINWLDHNNNYPFFIWVHLFDPHLSYRPPREYLTETSKNYKGPVTGEWYKLDASEKAKIASSPEDIRQMIALYDAEVAYADHEVGRLVDAAEQNAPNRRLLTIVTADHGESMGEHDLYWRRDLYDPTLLVPLIIVPPGDKFEKPLVIEDQVRLIDITPTILELVDIEPLKNMDGRSLSGLIKNNLPFIASAKSGICPAPSVYIRAASSIRYKGWKLISRDSGWDDKGLWANESLELYDLRSDPQEKINLASTSLKKLKELKEELEKYEHVQRSQELNLTPTMEERLRSLGYLR